MNAALILSTMSLLLCCFSFVYFRQYIRRRTTEEALSESRAEAYRLIAEIDSITDRDAQLIEERIKTLKILLEDTDKRIAVYVRELERSRSGEALYASLGRGVRTPLRGRAYPPAEPLSPSEPSPPAEPSSPVEPLRVKIAELAAAGLSPNEIASRLDISFSEVDLALSLLGHRER